MLRRFVLSIYGRDAGRAGAGGKWGPGAKGPCPSSDSWPSYAVQHCCSQSAKFASASARERIKRINKRIQIKFLINELPLNLYINYNFYSWRLCFVYDRREWFKRGGVFGEQEDEDVVFMGPGNLTRRRSFFRLHCIAGPAILIVFRIGGELLIKN